MRNSTTTNCRCKKNSCPICGSGQKPKPKECPAIASDLVHASTLSRLIPDLTLYHNPDGSLLDPTTVPATWFRNDEGSVWLAINPVDPKNMAIITQGDRFLGFMSTPVYYSRDGGCTWNDSNLVTTRFQGPGILQNEIGTDGSVVFDYAGNLYASAAQGNGLQDGNEIVFVAKSTDGGSSWDAPIIIASDNGNEHIQLTPDLVADPNRPNTVYLVYSDFQSLTGSSPDSVVYFLKTDDGGASWTQPVVAVAVTLAEGVPIKPRLEVLPNGDFVMLVPIVPPNGFASQGTIQEIRAYRSTDRGETWTFTTITDQWKYVFAVDPLTNLPAGNPADAIIGDIAVDRRTGFVYATWQDGRFNPTGGSGVVLSRSTDGGRTWSPPIPANPNAVAAQAFLPSIAVADDGTVGVFFYDFRFYGGSSDPSLTTDAWLDLFTPDLQFIGEVRLTKTSFDTRQAIIRRTRGFNGLWLSDYVKLRALGNNFLASFVVTNPPYGIGPTPPNPGSFVYDPRNRQDVVVSEVFRNCAPDTLSGCAQPPVEMPFTNELSSPPDPRLEGTYYLCPCGPATPPPPGRAARAKLSPPSSEALQALADQWRKRKSG